MVRESVPIEVAEVTSLVLVLGWVRDKGTDITSLTHAIAIEIVLVGVVAPWAVVGGVVHTIAIEVVETEGEVKDVRHSKPIGVCQERAGVTGITYAVAIGIGLLWIGVGGAEVIVVLHAIPITIELAAVRIDQPRTRVLFVGDTVTVEVILADVTDTIAIAVVLIGAGHERTEIEGVRESIAVVISLTCIANTVTITVLLPNVRNQGTEVARITDAIAIEIRSPGWTPRTGIERVFDAVTIAVVEARVARIANVVGIAVSLHGVGIKGAVVDTVDDTIVVTITAPIPRLTPVSSAVSITIELVYVGVTRAIVERIADAVTIRIEKGRIAGITHARVEAVELLGVRAPGTVVARSPTAIAIRIVLSPVGDDWAVVDQIAHAVAIGIVEPRLTGISDAVAVPIRLPGIGQLGTVVASISNSIGIGILLIWIGHCRAVVELVAQAIGIAVSVDIAARARRARAEIAQVAKTILVQIPLIVVGNRDTIVAGITNAVGILILLLGIAVNRAVVELIGDAVLIGIWERRVRLHVRLLIPLEQSVTAAVRPGRVYGDVLQRPISAVSFFASGAISTLSIILARIPDIRRLGLRRIERHTPGQSQSEQARQAKTSRVSLY